MAPSSTTKSGAGSKRKAAQEPIAMVPQDDDGHASDSGASSSSSSSSSSDPSFINVDFDFLAPNPTLDEPAIRRLLRQLFYTHADDLDLFCLADYVVRAPNGVGTVLKVEGDEEQDPFAFVGALPLGTKATVELEGEDGRAAKLVTDYLVKHLPEESPISSLLLGQGGARPYLFLHERFINLPPQVAPPLYRLATEELAEACKGEGKEEPTHVLFLSRVFSSEAYSDDEGDEEMEEGKPAPMRVDEDDEDAPRGMRSSKTKKSNKAKKPRRTAPSSHHQKGDRLPLGHFRPEDPLLSSYNPTHTHTATYRFPAPRNAQEGFESPLFGHVIAMRWEDLKGGEVWERVAEGLVGEAGVGVQ